MEEWIETLEDENEILEERVDYLEAQNAGLRAELDYWEEKYKKAKDCLKENRRNQRYRSNGTEEDDDYDEYDFGGEYVDDDDPNWSL